MSNELLKDVYLSYLFSGLVAVLVFLLMRLTISLVAFLMKSLFGPSKTYMAANRYITIFCLLVALVFGVLGHGWWDALQIWYTSPLDAPLNIIR